MICFKQMNVLSYFGKWFLVDNSYSKNKNLVENLESYNYIMESRKCLTIWFHKRILRFFGETIDVSQGRSKPFWGRGKLKTMPYFLLLKWME